MAKFFAILFIFITTIVSAQSITLPTYYPSPRGNYKHIRIIPQSTFTSPNDPCIDNNQIGLFYVDGNNHLQFCRDDGSSNGEWLTLNNIWTLDSNNLYDTELNINNQIGIGTTTPDAKVTIQGKGTSWTSTSLNATNFSGNTIFNVRDDGHVGIGTTDIDSNFVVYGTASYPTPVELKIANMANQGNSQIVFSEGDQGRNLSIRYHTHPSIGSRNWLEFWGYWGHLTNDRPTVKFVRDFEPSTSNYASVCIGYPSIDPGGSPPNHNPSSYYQPSAKLEIHSRGHEDIFCLWEDPDNDDITIGNTPDQKVFVITDSGKVGIGETNPSATVDINGDIRADSITITSDKTLKKYIHPINSTIEKIIQLQGVHFQWKDSKEKDIGLIAQDVEKIFPELVSTDKQGLKSIAYSKLIPFLVNGIKDLQKEEEELLKQIEQLEKEN